MRTFYTKSLLETCFEGIAGSWKTLGALFFVLATFQTTAQIRVIDPSDAGISLVSNNTYTVRWAKGGTAFNRVRIKLSVDGGLTFPYLLANNTPNTGTDSSEVITIPGIITNQARIRITNQADSTVGDVSDNNFAITGYCWPWGMSCTNNFIQNFTINTLNSSSTCSVRAYVSYAPSGARTTNLYTGSTVGFTLKTSKTNPNMGVAIWCDFNDDKDFDDTDEFLFASSVLDTTHTGTITIPSIVAPGLKTFRIRTVRANLLNSGSSCTFFNTGGEIEDYRVNILSLPGTGPIVVRTPNASGINLDNNTNYTVRWSKGSTTFDRVRIKLSADGGLTYPYLLVNNTNSTLTDTAENIVVPGIITTQARIRITNQNDSTVGGDFSDNNFTIRGYCWPWGMNCSGNQIQNFTLNTLNSASGCSPRAYINYNATRTTTLYSGQSYPFSITTSSANSGVGIWCDFNGDFDFDDAGELLYVSPSLSNSFSGTIVMPTITAFANRRLRIRTIEGSLPGASDACTFYASGGEIEDYIVSVDQIIGAGPLVVQVPSASGITLTSNSTSTARWSKAGTTYSRVKIKFSEDGGLTFPYLLVNNTPNTSTDTSENFTVPGIITNQARIQITNQNDSTIGDISDNDFAITGYCWPWNTSCTNNFIRNVQLNTLNNTSTCATRAYVSNAASGANTTTLYTGQTYPITIRTSKTNPNMGVAVWCDFNNDLSFDDTGEFLYASPSLDTTFTANINIPEGTSIGQKRLRIRTVNNTLLTSDDYCTYFSNGGEIEDYTITLDVLSGAGPLVVREPNNTGISITSTGSATYTARWSKGATTYDRVQIKLSANGGATYPYLLVNNTPSLSTDTSESFVIPGIITNQARIRIANQNDSTESDISDNDFAITGYCWPWGMSCTNNFVSQFSFNTLSRTSTCATRAYSLTGATGANTTTVYPGEFYSFTIKTSKVNTNQGVGVWCDFNNDQDFNDAGEFLFGGSTLDTTFTGEITIPTGVSTGQRRLRVRNVRGSLLTSADACTFFAAGGEIEDYTITIDQPTSSGPLVVRQPNAPGISLATNTTYPVRWSKGGTTYGRVRIKMSADGGATFPYLLVDNTPNLASDTSENITVPGIITNQARIRITNQSDSTVGDVSDNNFTITGYCWPWGMSCTNNSINGFTFNTLSRTSTCGTTRGYLLVTPATGNNTTTVSRGASYPFSISTSTASPNMAVGIWCDFNNDQDFDDAGEFLYGSPSFGNNFSGNITIPETATNGLRRLRVRTVRSNLLSAGNACTFYNTGGEIEDYTINISQPTITFTSVPVDICPGTPLSVTFTSTGQFPPSNSFYVQISAPGGTFGPSNPVVGTGAGSPIACYVPLGTAAGAYRLRVVSLLPSPSIISTESALFNVRTSPSAPTSSNVSRCGPGTVTLAASGCTTTEWYDAQEQGNLVGTGASFVTPVLSENTTYYATCVDGQGCQSVRTAAQAIVNPLPTIGGFSPTIGIVGFSNILINGVGFSALDSVVFTGGKRGTVGAFFSASINVIPPIDAQAGPITVYTRCGTATSSQSFTPVVPTIAAPVIALASGTYPSLTTTTLSCATAGASIYYTLDGSTPTPGAANTRLYNGTPVEIGTNLTLRAIGFRTGWITSSVSSATYTITTRSTVSTPTITPATGSYTGGQVITISCSTPNTQIYFLYNGQVPLPGINNPILYQGPITLVNSATVRAVAIRDGWANSAFGTVFLTISGATSLGSNVYSPPPGVYSSPQLVTITNPDPLAQIYYTIDGTDPYVYAPLARLYAGPVAINTTSVLKSSSFRLGFGDGPRVRGDYVINAVRAATDLSGNEETVPPSAARMSVYPNPTDGSLFVDFGSEKENVKITVLNLLGQIVKSVEVEGAAFGTALDLSENPSGIYIVRMKDEAGNATDKKVVLK